MWVTEDGKPQPPLEGGEAPCELPTDQDGEDLQKISVAQTLPNLLQGDARACMQRVVPEVRQALPTAGPEFQLAASSSFLSILEKELVHPTTFTQTFLRSILTSIDSKDPVVANAWLETLLDVIELLPSDVIRKEILSIAVYKGQLSQPIASRLACSKLLGKIATKFEPFLIKKELLPIVQSLCQDVNYEVRACICQQLEFVARGLGPELARPNLLPALVELANDEESFVRLAAVDSVVNMLGLLDDDTCKQTIIPLVKKLCENSFKAEDSVLPVIARQLGKLCLGLQNNLTLKEKEWFVTFFQKLAQLGVPHLSKDSGKNETFPMPDVVPVVDNADKYTQCRQQCAYNFPAMVLFTSGPENFHEKLYVAFCDLACDPYFVVRRTIACGIHEVARLLGSSNRMIKCELVKLLKEDSEEVLQGLIPNISTTLELLTHSHTLGPDVMDSTVVEIGRALLQCEGEVSSSRNWRLHALLLEQLECLIQCMPSDFIYSHFVPVIFLRIHKARPLPCRLAAARTLLVFLRYNLKANQRLDIRRRIYEELCRGKSCYSRMLYLKMSDMMMELFSVSYYKEYFFLGTLELAEDPVPNIRLKFCSILPKLKALLKLPADRKLLQALETSLRKLLHHEKDRDVSTAVRIAIEELDKIEMMIELRSTGVFNAFELEDQKKQEEEKSLAEQGSTIKKAEKRNSGAKPPSSSERITANKTRSSVEPKAHSSSVTDRRTERKGNSVPSSTGMKSPGSTPMGAKSNSRASTSQQQSSSQFTQVPSLDPIDPSTDEFYIDAGIRISNANFNKPAATRIPNLQEVFLHSRASLGTKEQVLRHYMNQQYDHIVDTMSLKAADLSQKSEADVSSSGHEGPKRTDWYGKRGEFSGIDDMRHSNNYPEKNFSRSADMDVSLSKKFSGASEKNISANSKTSLRQRKLQGMKSKSQDGDMQGHGSRSGVGAESKLSRDSHMSSIGQGETKSAVLMRNRLRSQSQNAGYQMNVKKGPSSDRNDFRRSSSLGSTRISSAGLSRRGTIRPQSCVFTPRSRKSSPNYRSLSDENLQPTGVGTTRKQAMRSQFSFAVSMGNSSNPNTRSKTNMGASRHWSGSRIPRNSAGQPISSCHSSPGTSRASSPSLDHGDEARVGRGIKQFGVASSHSLTSHGSHNLRSSSCETSPTGSRGSSPGADKADRELVLGLRFSHSSFTGGGDRGRQSGMSRLPRSVSRTAPSSCNSSPSSSRAPSPCRQAMQRLSLGSLSACSYLSSFRSSASSSQSEAGTRRAMQYHSSSNAGRPPSPPPGHLSSRLPVPMGSSSRKSTK